MQDNSLVYGFGLPQTDGYAFLMLCIYTFSVETVIFKATIFFCVFTLIVYNRIYASFLSFYTGSDVLCL